FFFSSRRRHTRFSRDWSSDVCSSDLPDFVAVDIKSRHELDVTDVVAPQVDVHEARHELLRGSFPVVGDALDERGRAVADADYGRSEERRVGKERRLRWSREDRNKK